MATVWLWLHADTLGVTMDRVKLLRGRMFRPTAAGEAVIDPQLASMEHLRPGATLRMTGIPYNPKGGAPDLGLAFPVSFLVTGIGVFDDQIVPVTGTNNEPRILLSPAFSRTARAQSVIYLPEAGVRLRPGASPAAFAATARTLAARYPQVQSSYTVVVNLADEIAATQRAIRPQAVALAVCAGLAGLISLAVIGQLLVRQLSLAAAEFPALRAIGMTPRSLLALSVARLALVTGAGAVLAAAIAVAASPLTPIGTARLAEPAPGVRVDVPVLAAGLAVIALLPLALLVLPAWRSVRRTASPPGVAMPATRRARPSLLATALTSAGPVTTGIGMRMAFEPGRGRTAVPVRSALTGTTIAIAALVGAAVFGTTLVGLVTTPARYGANWDAELNIGFAGVSGPLGARLLSAVPGVAGYAAGNTGQVTVDGAEVPAIGVDPVRGGGYLTLLAGRAPAGPGEIALGAQTLHAIRAHLGQTVRVAVTFSTGQAGTGTSRPMRIVGEAVFPDFGLPELIDTDLGNGALVSTTLLSETMPETGCVHGATCYNFFVLRYRPGTDTGTAAASLLAAAAKAGCPFSACSMTADQRPGDIRNYASVRDTPLVLAVVLAVLAAGTLAHVLLTGVRHRRRDLALLKTLGFTRSQVQGVVAWEASTFAAVALTVGVPAGVVAGRWAWTLFANAIGVAAQATVQLPLILLAIAATLLLANLIAAWPGWRAARLRPAAVLRTE